MWHGPVSEQGVPSTKLRTRCVSTTQVVTPRMPVCEAARCKSPGTGWHSCSKSQDMGTQGTDERSKDGRPGKAPLLDTRRSKPTWLHNAIQTSNQKNALAVL